MLRPPPFTSCPVEGCFLQPYAGWPAEAPRHCLGGAADDGGECSACARPLRRLLRLDARDSRLELPRIAGGVLELLRCPQCEVTRYTLTSRGELLVLGEAAEGEPNLTNWSPGKAWPPLPETPVLLHAIPERVAEARMLVLQGRVAEAADWVQRFDWQSPVHQVGGVPLVLGPGCGIPVCELCGSNMPFLASVAMVNAETTDDEPGPTQTLFFLCRSCPSILAVHDAPAD
jgi:hypothetical protein